MLNLKIIWSASAVIGIGWSLLEGAQGAPIAGWAPAGQWPTDRPEFGQKSGPLAQRCSQVADKAAMKREQFHKTAIFSLLGLMFCGCADPGGIAQLDGIDEESGEEGPQEDEDEPAPEFEASPRPAIVRPDTWVEGDRVFLRTRAPESIGDLIPGANEYLVAVESNTGHAIVNVLDESDEPVFLVAFESESPTFEQAPHSASAMWSRHAVDGCAELPCLPASSLAGAESDRIEFGSWATILAVGGSIDGISFETVVDLDAEGVPTTMIPSGGPLDLAQQDRLNILGEVLLDVTQYSEYLSAAGEEAVPTGGHWGCEFGRYATLGGLGVLWGACCVATAETAGAGCVLCSAGAKAAGDAVLDYDCGG